MMASNSLKGLLSDVKFSPQKERKTNLFPAKSDIVYIQVILLY